MPDSWDPAIYRDRAKQWREKAASLPMTDPTRVACEELAKGYERLAARIEEQKKLLCGRG